MVREELVQRPLALVPGQRVADTAIACPDSDTVAGWAFDHVGLAEIAAQHRSRSPSRRYDSGHRLAGLAATVATSGAVRSVRHHDRAFISESRGRAADEPRPGSRRGTAYAGLNKETPTAPCASGNGSCRTFSAAVNAARKASSAATSSPEAQPSNRPVPMSSARLRDGGVVDLAGARLASARHVGDLNLADGIAAATDQLDQVPLADLGVVQVEHHLDVGMSDGFDQCQRVLGAGQRNARMVDDGVEVFHAEGHACACTEFAECLQPAQRRDHIPRWRGTAAALPGRRRVRRCAS